MKFHESLPTATSRIVDASHRKVYITYSLPILFRVATLDEVRVVSINRKIPCTRCVFEPWLSLLIP